MKRPILLFAFIALLVLSAAAQPSEQVLAIAAGQRILVQDLPKDTADEYSGLAAMIADRRKELLELQIIDILGETEAAARKTTFEKLFELEVKSKVPDPTPAQIEKVYNENRAAIGDRTLAQVRDDIVRFLRSEPEQKLFEAFVAALKTKYKVTTGKDVNLPTLAPADVLASVNGKPITADQFESKNKVALFEAKMRVFDQLKYDLDRLILSALSAAEAKSLGLEPYQFIGREITDKLREFTDEEREELEAALRRRLFAKYKPQILYSEPPPLAFNIATDGRPSRGAPTAPVTVVMFSDFQCSVCAAKHPVLQRVLAEYGTKVRFVVRTFPLQTIHKDAYNAALAATAAAQQGKFFEYTDLLYKNQSALDVASLKSYAAQVGLNPQKFELDFQSPKTAADVKKDIDDGDAIGITGTPSIYVNGVRVRFLNADGFRDAIDKALAKK